MKWAIILAALLAVSIAKPLSKLRPRRLHKCAPLPVTPEEPALVIPESVPPSPSAESLVAAVITPSAPSQVSNEPLTTPDAPIIEPESKLNAPTTVATALESEEPTTIQTKSEQSEEVSATTITPSDEREIPVTTEVLLVEEKSNKLDESSPTTVASISEPEISVVTEINSQFEGSGEPDEVFVTTVVPVVENEIPAETYINPVVPIESKLSDITDAPKESQFSEESSPAVNTNAISTYVPQLPSKTPDVSTAGPDSKEPSNIESSTELVNAHKLSLPTEETRAQPVIESVSTSEVSVSEKSQNDLVATSPKPKPRAPLQRFVTFTFFDREAKTSTLKHFLDYLRTLKK